MVRSCRNAYVSDCIDLLRDAKARDHTAARKDGKYAVLAFLLCLKEIIQFSLET